VAEEEVGTLNSPFVHFRDGVNQPTLPKVSPPGLFVFVTFGDRLSITVCSIDCRSLTVREGVMLNVSITPLQTRGLPH
jgi:hypothetical protein